MTMNATYQPYLGTVLCWYQSFNDTGQLVTNIIIYKYANSAIEFLTRGVHIHATKKIMIQFSYPVKQDEVEAARESCMEEECERVEAEIQKERVHNENRMLKVSR